MSKIKYIILSSCLLSAISVNAQRNFYHRIDVGSSNVYSFVLSNLMTGFANYYAHDMLFDNSYIYTLYDGDLKTRGLNPIGLTSCDIFNDAFAGVKLGYHSDSFGAFNWGFYVSGHYRINQVDAKVNQYEVYRIERFQYLKPGIGTLLTFGGVESDLKVQLEAAMRYDMPLNYKGRFGSGNKWINSGISSHYSIKFAGNKSFSAGVFLDMNHYNIYKQSEIKFKPYSFGVTFTITPKRGEDIYD